MDEIRLDGKVAIVTGAGRGLGREHARLLASRGAAVVVNDVGAGDDPADPRPAAQVVAEQIEAAGGRAVANGTPVGTAEAAAELLAATLDAYGRIDVVVNNAGILRDRTLAKLTAEELDAVLRVHLAGTIWTSQAAWPHFIAQGGGVIVNTTSAAGLFGNFGQVNYAAAKAGILGATKAMALEGARWHIRVNAIEPGAATRMTQGLLGELADKLSPALVSPLVAWLACDECQASGECYNAGGGRIARVLVAQTPGYFSPALSPEQVRDHWAEVNDEGAARVVADFPGEMAVLTGLLHLSVE